MYAHIVRALHATRTIGAARAVRSAYRKAFLPAPRQLSALPVTEFWPTPMAMMPFPFFGETPESQQQYRTLWRRPPAMVSGATVYGNCFAVASGSTLIQQDKEETQIPLFVANYSDWLKPSSGKFLLDVSRIKKTSHIERATLIGNRVCWNYFHWTFEALPKLLSSPGDDPVIVSARMPVQHFQSLALLTDRPVIRLADHEALRVDELTLPPSHCYLPDDQKFWGTAAVSRKAVRTVAAAYAGLDQVPAKANDILWVSRTPVALKTGTRDVANVGEIEALLLSCGAKLFHPHDASLKEQRRRFESARLVVLPAGAAFSNVVFCQAGTTVIALAQAKHTDLASFADIAQALGLRFAVVYGSSVPNKSPFPAHWDFAICPDALRRALAWADGAGEPDGLVQMTTLLVAPSAEAEPVF